MQHRYKRTEAINRSIALGPCYMDMFSNHSIFISLRFQIDPTLDCVFKRVAFHDNFHRFHVKTGGETAMILLRFQMEMYPCNLRSHYDIVAFSPPVHTETMKTIIKRQTFEYANQIGSI